MGNQHRRKEWLAFRDEVIELDGETCRQCGRGPEDGVILQVHHKIYIPGRLPWEYAYSDCETLCKGCHSATHGLTVPKVGWTHCMTDDLGDLSGVCELCGTEIRYVFVIDHPHWEPMAVGTICCDNLTETKIASNHMESVRRYISRQNRFVSSCRWKTENGIVSIRQKGIDIDIRQATDGFRIFMNELKGGKFFAEIDAAKMLAFKSIEDGSAEEYIRKHEPKKVQLPTYSPNRYFRER